MMTVDDLEHEIRKRGISVLTFDLKMIRGKVCVRAVSENGKQSAPELARETVEQSLRQFLKIEMPQPAAPAPVCGSLEDLLG